jgi:hypothetical protein
MQLQCSATEGAMNRNRTLNIAGIVLLLFGAGQLYFRRDMSSSVPVAYIVAGALFCLIASIGTKH